MNFFSNQDRARRNTWVLVALFLAAVTLIMLTLSLIVYGVISFHTRTPDFPQWLVSPQGLTTGGVVLAVLLAPSLIRYLDLRGGGERVARMVGARAIPLNTQDPDERQLRHVTEEMAIASGVTMPRLYLMDQEESINAFVAGYQPNEAVLVVTRGAIGQLTRDELQGVVGHEFSHILNGDMRINIRLIALLTGILLIGQFGQALFRSAMRRSHHRSFWTGSGSQRNDGAPLLAGFLLMVVGYVGLFFGRLIKSAISRQREFLADAASVQFTRHPQGIAGALYKIGLNAQGARLETTPHAEDMNHLCFGETIPAPFSRFMASHPPIEDRIKAIDPALVARMRARYGTRTRPAGTSRDPMAHNVAQEGVSSLTGSSSSTPGATPAAPSAAASVATTMAAGSALSASAGHITEKNEDYARQLLSALPHDFYELIHSTSGAVHLVVALILDPQTAADQEDALADMPTAGPLSIDRQQLQFIQQNLTNLGPAIRLPALDLALPGLRELDAAHCQTLLSQINAMARMNNRVSLYEFAVIGFLSKHLSQNAGKATPVKFRRYQPVLEDVRSLLWLMARATSGNDGDDASALYRRIMAGFEKSPQFPADPAVSARSLQQSLRRLSRLSPMLKPGIIDACGDCALSNGRISIREYELLRIIADQLDCPMPPLLVG